MRITFTLGELKTFVKMESSFVEKLDDRYHLPIRKDAEDVARKFILSLVGKWEAVRTSSSDRKTANQETPRLLLGVNRQLQSTNFLPSIKNGRQRSAPNLN